MPLSPRKNDLASLFKEVRVFKGFGNCLQIRSSENGLADRGGWRKEIPFMQEFQTSFLRLSSPLPQVPEKGLTSLGTYFWCMFGSVFVNSLLPSPFSGAKKEPQSQKIARTAPKNFLNNSRVFLVMTHSNKGFEGNRTRKFTRKFGEIFVAKVLWGTFSVPDFCEPLIGDAGKGTGQKMS